MDFKNIMDHVFQKSVVEPFSNSHRDAFVSRLPDSIKEKLTDEEIGQLCEISLERINNAAKFTVGSIGGFFK